VTAKGERISITKAYALLPRRKKKGPPRLGGKIFQYREKTIHSHLMRERGRVGANLNVKKAGESAVIRREKGKFPATSDFHHREAGRPAFWRSRGKGEVVRLPAGS